VSEQHVNITVGSGAVLEWFPEHTIPFAGSRFRQTLQATLASGATLLLWDAVASGRIARGERWAFTDLENDIRITTASGSSLLERYVLDPSTDLGRVGLAEEWNYVASFYVVNDAMASEVWSRLESKIAAILDARPGEVLGGVSTPPVPGLAVKVLTRTAAHNASSIAGLPSRFYLERPLTSRLCSMRYGQPCVKDCGISRRCLYGNTKPTARLPAANCGAEGLVTVRSLKLCPQRQKRCGATRLIRAATA
jgi:hypothetical protein